MKPDEQERQNSNAIHRMTLFGSQAEAPVYGEWQDTSQASRYTPPSLARGETLAARLVSGAGPDNFS